MSKASGLVPRGRCRCGKTHADCVRDWDRRLNLPKGRTSDAQSGVSEYEQARRKIAEAKANGLDVYCNRLNSRTGH